MTQTIQAPIDPIVTSAPVATKTRGGIRGAWGSFENSRPGVAQFIMFSVLSTGMTVLQLVLMPVSKWLFGMSDLVYHGFQWLMVGTATNGQPYYVFDYAGGALPDGGGGLAYFLAIQVTLGIAQIINFFLQRNVTFKSNTNPWPAAAWYAIAYVIISFGAAALQGIYKIPLYELLVATWELGALGATLADVTTMLINAMISFCVFFPIFKIIFRRVPTAN